MLACSGCKKEFLDREPYDALSNTVIWNSEKTATLGINGIYQTFAQDSWYTIYWYATCLAPEGFTIVRSDFGLAHATGTTTPLSQRILTVYSDFYKTIKYANEAIFNLTDNPNLSKEAADRLIGEAKFNRALSYFYLWQLFGGVVILDKPVPAEETFLERSSADEVKQFILADFTDAVAKLPVTHPGTSLGRATKGAAIAMLGKTLLYDKQWEKAAEQFALLMTAPYSYKLTEEYSNSFFWQTESNSETVYDLQYISELGYGSDIDTRYGFRNHPRIGQDYASATNIGVEIFTNKDGTSIDRSTIPLPSNFGNEKLYGEALMAWYQTTYANADPRLQKSIVLPGSNFVGALNVPHKLYWPTGAGTNPPSIRTTFPNDALLPIRKFLSPGEDAPIRRNSPVNWPLIRYADVLLMYAEAKNEAAGPTAEVFDAVNKIKTRAGIAGLPASLSQDEMRQNIRLERLREFLFEAQSYFDVRRWKTAHTNDPIFGLNQDIYDFRYSTKFYKKVFNEGRDYLWPIPAVEIDLNPKMTQNPGW